MHLSKGRAFLSSWQRMVSRWGSISLALLGLLLPLAAAEKAKSPQPPADSPWGEWLEDGQSFFGSVLDARGLGPNPVDNNLVPRGLIMDLGHGFWGCYDVDLLRLACVWRVEKAGLPITAVALSTGSYHVAGQKTKDGQEHLPQPIGEVLISAPLAAGWQRVQSAVLQDPRAPTPSPQEVGRGPLPEGMGRLLDLVVQPNGRLRLRLLVAGRELTEQIEVQERGGEYVLCRHIEAAADQQELVMLTGVAAQPLWPLAGQGTVSWEQSLGRKAGLSRSKPLAARPPAGVVITQARLAQGNQGLLQDALPLPVDNPWKRNVRLADLAFTDKPGQAMAVAFDGDVWCVEGLSDRLGPLRWRRWARGLHEPMSIVARGEEILVFDRNGIWRLQDRDGDGWAERHELFCGLLAQTAETREFPNSMKLGPGGELFVAKGGQQGSTLGRDNGAVFRIAADGRSIERLAHGLRQPFIGVHPKTGLVTASDQQGHYVPSTPLHRLSGDQFYGHLPTIVPARQYAEPIAEPWTWIPHPVNASGASQIWLEGARMGSLAGSLLHLGYNRPELFLVLPSGDQAAVISLSRDFDFPTLNGAINPADGRLYLIGFQVWGTVVKRLSGLSRLRVGEGGLPRLLQWQATDKGVVLHFNELLDKVSAQDPENYSAERWNYRRSELYGSPHLKLDGKPGQEYMAPTQVVLGKDGRSVLVALADMKAGVHQMRLGWGIKTTAGQALEQAAYFSPWSLARFDGQAMGFGEVQVSLQPRAVSAKASKPASLQEGARLYQMMGCMACHSTDGSLVGKVGPSWRGLYGSMRPLAKVPKGSPAQVLADEAYLRESIVNPSAKVVKGFEKFDTGMPIYAGILNDMQIESLLLYIRSLK